MKENQYTKLMLYVHSRLIQIEKSKADFLKITQIGDTKCIFEQRVVLLT